MRIGIIGIIGEIGIIGIIRGIGARKEIKKWAADLHTA